MSCLLVITLVCLSLVTQGSAGIWPLPQYATFHPAILTIDPASFEFKVTNETCDVLIDAVKRFKNVVRKSSSHSYRADDTCGHQLLSVVSLELTEPCEKWPHLYMGEHYELQIGSRNVINSSSVWGLLRGLETFSQLIYPEPNSSCLVINSTSILDYPRFPHRGLLLDTSRHFLSMPIIYNILSAMEMNKMNVFHWHIVDDQSFPYQSPIFPSLSDLGAFKETFVYSQENISSIIEYARLRGIRVIPEFDSPGHTQSWGKGVPKLLTPCFTNGTFNGDFGPIDPSRSQNYKFINSLFNEVKKLFPDKYFHLGGDEVNFDCWKSNDAIHQFMKENNITSYEGLEDFYINRVLDIVDGINASSIVWQEVFINNVRLRNNTLVHIWLGDRAGLLANVTKKGHFALSSEGWYLDHLQDVWQDFYRIDLTNFNGTSAQQALVMGGEACMWGEMVDETNIVSRIWPRTSAVAEKLWSNKKTDQVESRIAEHVCYMKRRGVAASPANGPGFCQH